jgi:hypothetical protein
MAVKARPTASSKKKPQKAKGVEDIIEQYKVITETRYMVAKEIYDSQDSLTQEVLDRIRDRLRIASTGLINVNGQPVKLEQKYIDFNLLFLATEILSDLALNSVRVAKFKPSQKYCIECKKEIFKTGIEPKRKRK